MKFQLKHALSLSLVAVILVLAGCSSNGDRIANNTGIKGAPAWVNEGSLAALSGAGRVIRGVGSAAHIDDRALQKDSADNRARAEVARILSTYLEMMAEDYSNGNPTAESRQLLTQQINAATRSFLRNARIIGNWRDQNDGKLYALAELDLQAVQTVLRTSEIMAAGFRRFVVDNGEPIYDQVHQRIR